MGRVNVQGVKSLGCHFACLCREFEFYEVKKNLLLFFKKKREILLHFYSEKFLKKSKIAQIYYYDPQSAGINVQSPQSESTPNGLTLSMGLDFENSEPSKHFRNKSKK